MFWLYLILISILGAVIGGIVNVTVFRLEDEIFSLKKKSSCRTCLTPIHWTDSIPIFSFFKLKGRCRHCSTAIEWQYPAIELAMAVLFAAFFARAAFGYGLPIGVEDGEWLALFVRDAVMVIFLTIIFVFDFKKQVILDRFTIPAIILTIIFNIALGIDASVMLLGGLILGAFFAIQFLASDGHWVGGGDIRMGLLIGFLLGPILGMISVLFAYILGAIIGIYIILAKHRSLHDHMPFGTFLAISTIVVMLFGEVILGWYLSFF